MLSLVVITHNEEARIRRCLASVPFATERIVIDAHSTDATVEIARAAGATVLSRSWTGFSDQKNFGMSQATQPWILSLDADEWLDPDAAAHVKAALANPSADGYRLARCTRWGGRWLRHGRMYPDRQLRLVRRGRARWTDTLVHERLSCDGEVADLACDIAHEPYPDRLEPWRRALRYADLAADALDAQGARARRRDLLFRPPLRFVDAYFWRAGFLDGHAGLVLAAVGAAYTGRKWGRLWQRQHSGSR